MTGRVKLVSVALLLTVVAGGCGRTPGDANPPWCDDFTVLVLAAQSAPTAWRSRFSINLLQTR